MAAGVGVQAADTVNDGSQAAVQAAAGCGDGIAVAQRNTGHRQVNVAVDLAFAAMVDGHIAASVTAAFPAKIEIHIKSGFIAAGRYMLRPRGRPRSALRAGRQAGPAPGQAPQSDPGQGPR